MPGDNPTTNNPEIVWLLASFPCRCWQMRFVLYLYSFLVFSSAYSIQFLSKPGLHKAETMPKSVPRAVICKETAVMVSTPGLHSALYTFHLGPDSVPRFDLGEVCGPHICTAVSFLFSGLSALKSLEQNEIDPVHPWYSRLFHIFCFLDST